MAHQPLGESLPDFTLPVLDGGQSSLAESLADKRGAVAVFWSGVCSHCRRYDGYLNAFSARHPELALIVVASRQDESAADLRTTVSGRGLTFPILHDADRRIAHAWLAQQTPRVFLLDAKRRLLYRGAIDNFKYPADPEHQPYLEAAITAFLAGKAIERQETASFGCAVESVYYGLPKPL
ncbi:MAG: redoxin domain-containing protein [bacterium]|nr:redoxin domain-containing protein [bacterium]